MYRRIVVCITLLILFTTAVFAQQAYWFDTVVEPAIEEKKPLVRERNIHPGVLHLTDFNPEGPFLVNVVRIDLTQPLIRLEAEKARNALFAVEKTSQMATRENRSGHHVVAAINADFWRNQFIPVGPFVDEGMIYKSHHINVPRAAFMVDSEGTPHIGVPEMHMTLIVDAHTTFPINVINVNGDNPNDPLPETNLVLYNNLYGYSTPGEPTNRTEVVLQLKEDEFIPNKPCRAAVVAMRKDKTNTRLYEGYVVLSGAGEAKTFLEQNLAEGKEVTLDVRVPGVDKAIVLMVGGGPLLIQKGEIKIDNETESIGDSFVTDKHPRTALGFSKDKKTLFLFTIDGRQPGLSAGADLEWVARYLKQLGAYEAMNLDGGGSTTMWVRGEVINRPSDREGERNVTNSLLVVSESTVGAVARLEIHPPAITVPTGGSVDLTVFGYDAHLNPVNVTTKDLVFDLDPELGAIVKGEMFKASPDAGEGRLKVGLKTNPDVKTSVPVKIELPVYINVEPEVLLMWSNDEFALNVTLLNEEGVEMEFSPEDLTITAPECIAINRQEMKVRAKEKGSGYLQVQLGDVATSVPVYVEIFREEMIYAFDTVPSVPEGEATLLSGTNFERTKTHVRIDKIYKKEGEGGLRLDYAMNRGGTTAIYIPLNAAIQTQPHELTLWVFGDKKMGWLRGELIDKDHESFLIDFTNSTAGIFWNGWRQIRIDSSALSPKWTNPGAMLDYPAVLKHIYVAQSREAYKANGSIVLDALSAIYPPSTSPETSAKGERKE